MAMKTDRKQNACSQSVAFHFVFEDKLNINLLIIDIN